MYKKIEPISTNNQNSVLSLSVTKEVGEEGKKEGREMKKNEKKKKDKYNKNLQQIIQK